MYTCKDTYIYIYVCRHTYVYIDIHKCMYIHMYIRPIRFIWGGLAVGSIDTEMLSNEYLCNVQVNM